MVGVKRKLLRDVNKVIQWDLFGTCQQNSFHLKRQCSESLKITDFNCTI